MLGEAPLTIVAQESVEELLQNYTRYQVQK